MLRAILFDMDDTLLDNSEEYHLALWESVAQHLRDLAPSADTDSALQLSAQAVLASDGTGPTCLETVYSVCAEAAGVDCEVLRRWIEKYWTEAFPALQSLTRPLPEARLVIEWAFRRGLQVAIVSGSFSLRTALEQRLEWAGIPASEFNYALLTTLENMHAFKPNPVYYLEILAKLGRQPGECLMVGNSWEEDIAPAASVGIPCYWIADPAAEALDEGIPLVGQGTLSDLLACLKDAEQQGFPWQDPND